MTTKMLLTSCVLAAVLLQSRAATSPNSAATEGVTVETGGEKLDAVKETPAQRDARMAWWREAKFGLFIHWGVYAVPAGKFGDKTSYGEWIMQSARIPVPTYREFAAQFNPVKYNPELWVKTAKDAGMKYIVITSKHHDGFAMFGIETCRGAAWEASEVLWGLSDNPRMHAMFMHGLTRSVELANRGILL